jgi:hypothetical protein
MRLSKYTIYCPVCGAPCGLSYPDTRTEPGFMEGKGEDFVFEGKWHCSQECVEQTKIDVAA